jgi:hypothetical protein
MTLARFVERVPGSTIVENGASIASASWGRRALLVVGGFHGSLKLHDMEVETSPDLTTQCRSIDPAFYVGPHPIAKPTLERTGGSWRGWPRVRCPELTHAVPTRTFKSALFVASLPTASFR